jgi:hypothetical protein
MATRVIVDVARRRGVASLAYEAVDNLTSPDTSIIQDRSAFPLFIVLQHPTSTSFHFFLHNPVL